MPRVTLTVQSINNDTGLTPTYAAAETDGNAFLNTGSTRKFIHIKTGATGTTLTLVTPKTVETLAIADKAYVIGVNTEEMIGPLNPSVYNQTDGLVHMNYTSVATVTVAVIGI